MSDEERREANPLVARVDALLRRHGGRSKPDVPVLTEVVDEQALARRPALDAQALEVLAGELERTVLERLGAELERMIEDLQAELADSARRMLREAVAAAVARALARPEK